MVEAVRQRKEPFLNLSFHIEQRLSDSGLAIEQLVQSENQQQPGDQVSVSNCIGRLRILGAINDGSSSTR